MKPSECPFCDNSWAQADSNGASCEEVLVVSLDQFRQHLGKHLQQVALFSLPKLIQGHDQSLGRHEDSEIPDRDAISEGNSWTRDNCGYGWSIVSRKRITIFALAFFLAIYRTQNYETYAMPQISYQNGSYKGTSYHDNKDLIQLLIDQGAALGAEHDQYNEALQAAAYAGYVWMIQHLLANGANVDSRGGKYGSALKAAVYGDQLESVELLIQSGVDINAESGNHGNVLYLAAYQGHKSIARLLLECGADINAQGGEYGNALYAAVHQGHESIVRLLLDRGADINAQGGRYGNALCTAVYQGHESIVRYLLECGADINAQSRINGNASHVAVSNGHWGILQVLLKNGADGNVQGVEYAVITVTILDADHNLLLRLSDSIGQLKQMIIEKVPPVKDTLAADPAQALMLKSNDKVLQNESHSCKQEELRQGSRVVCLLEKRLNPSSSISGIPNNGTGQGKQASVSFFRYIIMEEVLSVQSLT